MLAAQRSVSGLQPIQCPNNKSCRRPLQPMNLSVTTSASVKPNPNSNISSEWGSNKENVPPIYSAPAAKKDESFSMEETSFDASLADELSAARERLQRVKIDREKTDKLLGERVRILDLQMKEILNRGEVQKQLEMELDRLYRLKEIKIACQRISPVRSLRDKELEKKMN